MGSDRTSLKISYCSNSRSGTDRGGRSQLLIVAHPPRDLLGRISHRECDRPITCYSEKWELNADHSHCPSLGSLRKWHRYLLVIGEGDWDGTLCRIVGFASNHILQQTAARYRTLICLHRRLRDIRHILGLQPLILEFQDLTILLERMSHRGKNTVV